MVSYSFVTLRFIKTISYLFAFWLIVGKSLGYAQSNVCRFSLSVQVNNQLGKEAPAFSTIYVEEVMKYVVTDSLGFVSIPNLCGQLYHFHVYHIGCEEKIISLSINKDTAIEVMLAHDSRLLAEITLHDHESVKSPKPFSLGATQIRDKGNKDIADVFNHFLGVRSFQVGVGISKPQLEGLQNDRIDILNNGVVQAGQIWGNDHALEIDVFSSQHIELVKGVNVLHYSGSLAGGLLTLQPERINPDPHLHLSADYLLNTNGWGNYAHAGLTQYNSILPFRVGLTWKKSGDSHTPSYFLTNTGKDELDLNLQLEKTIRKIDLSLYYSLFSTEIGILLGSQISNLTDLQDAITRDVPFFTKDYFSYDINPPKQKVVHHLLKMKALWNLSHNKRMEFFYALQANDRQEFDVRRAGRSILPALSVAQTTHGAGIHFENFASPHFWTYKIGVQTTIASNLNDPATGILPIVPDYYDYKFSHFLTLNKKLQRLQLAAGYRLSYQYLSVYKTFSGSNDIMHNVHQFLDYTISADATYTPAKWQLFFGMVYGKRNPTIHELYSQGLHQGVSGIEEGNSSLGGETSFKMSAHATWNLSPRFGIHANIFYQLANDFIYLQVQPTFRLTIRGAFPVYKMQQADVNIYGGDLMLTYKLNDWMFTARYNTVRGDNKSMGNFLVGMPSDKVFGEVHYTQYLKPTTHPLQYTLSAEYTFRQNRLNTDQDFLTPPDGYFLLHAKIGYTFQVRQRSSLRISIGVENLLDQRYRNYLNRLRYFADETGRTFILHLSYKF